MTTAFFIALAIFIIFYHPPFQTSNYFKKIFRPIILIILMVLLIIIGMVKSDTSGNRNNVEAAKNESKMNTYTSEVIQY